MGSNMLKQIILKKRMDLCLAAQWKSLYSCLDKADYPPKRILIVNNIKIFCFIIFDFWFRDFPNFASNIKWI